MAKKRIILVGKAGSGKDFLRDHCIELGMKVDVSVTSRPMRDGETQGLTYDYVTKEEFIKKDDEGLFYEAVEFNGWYYGTLQESWDNNTIFIMTPSGINQIPKEDRAECLIVYIDINEAIRKERLSKRSDADGVERRLESDLRDFVLFYNFDLRITNPNFDAGHLIDLMEDLMKI